MTMWIHTLLRVPNTPGAGRTWGRLTITHSTQSAGAPVVDSAVAIVTRDDGRRVQARGVMVCPSPYGGDALTLAWRGSRDTYHLLRRLDRVPVLWRLATSRGHLA